MISTQKARPAWVCSGWRVSRRRESVTARNCRAIIGSTPISMNSVVSAPAQVLRKRKANRSASDDSWKARVMRRIGESSTGASRKAPETPR
ncbi:hypothetical protein D3C76_680920 [compost metagenome]